MKRPKVVRKRYTREAWRKIEEKAIEGMEKLAKKNNATYQGKTMDGIHIFIHNSVLDNPVFQW